MSQTVLNNALIMAAGRGNRMRPLTDLLPKAMVNFQGDTLIGKSLQMLRHAVPHVHVTVGYRKAMLSEYLMTRGGVDSIINTEGHGNAWWVQHTLMKHVDEPVLVLTTDNITELDLEFLLGEYDRLDCPLCMLVPVLPIDGIEGDFVEQAADGTVRSLQREVRRPTYCSGIQILNPMRVDAVIGGDVEDFYDLWNALIPHRALKASQIYCRTWFSIDTLEQLAQRNAKVPASRAETQQ